jgi:hypothetical protein
MRNRLRLRPLAAARAALLLCAACGIAQADEGDPPGRAARLSDLQGSVSMQPAGVTEWAAATLNRPLTTGDKVWSDRDSRVELDIGAAAMRLGPNTGFSFLNLDDYTAQMQLSEGILIVRVRELQPGQIYEVDTPNLAVLLQQPGEYRMEVNEAGDYTVVKVSEGAAQASGGGQTIAIGAQQAVSFSGTDTLAYQSATLGAPDDLDSWSATRERQLEDSTSRAYVADDVAGTQDLDNNGTWMNTPEYGYVWAPTVVVVGWAPYRFGHWVWITPWGWSWVDDARWGYVPSHYGRWARYNSNWCWVPGPRHGHRAVYAPALVGWVGGAAMSGARGGVAWFPLGPREVYVPGYRASPAYVRYVNITNTTIVNNSYITNVYEHNLTPLHYVNNTAAAVTAVPENVFTSGQRVGARALRLPPAALAGAQASAEPPAIAPIRQSVLGPTLALSTARPPAAVLTRPVVVRTPPPRAPVPLERQIAAIQANGGRVLTRADLTQLQPSAPAAPVRMVAAGPVISPGALARGDGAGHSPGTPRLPAQSPQPRSAAASQPDTSAPALIERERALQSSRASAALRLPVYPPPTAVRDDLYTSPTAARATTPAPPLRNDRPPSAQPHPPSMQQRPFAADDPAHVNTQPPALPVYHPPAAMPASPAAARPEALAPAPLRTPPVNQGHPINQFTPPNAPHPANPPPPQTAPAAAPHASPAAAKDPDPRGAGAHADRNSRDRAQR